MDSLDPQTRERIGAILADLSAKPGPLLLVLHEVQRVLGHIPPAAVPLIAQTLNLSRAEVHGVIGFYHYFRTTPGGRHRVQICRAESCQAMQGEALAAHAQRTLGIAFHETTPDGAFSLEPVYCLGNCACSPAVMIDEELHGRVTPERFEELITARRGQG